MKRVLAGICALCMVVTAVGCASAPQMAESGTERETQTQQQTEGGAETETKTAQAGNESQSETPTETATETATQTETAAVTETETQSETETQTETQMETETETQTETESETESETQTETETEKKDNGHTVALDAGHQGSWVDMSAQEPDAPGSSTYKAKATTGTVGSFTGVPEYQLNLDIALALETELQNRGYQVIMCRRDNDTAISNSERAIKAAEEGGEILVRIHANGSDDSSVSGALGMTPSPSNPYVSNLADDSYRLSETILNAYCAATGFGNDGIQYHDDMTGINWSTIPVTILEMGFMTNQGDDTAMQDPNMQTQMVTGIANGIDDYFGVTETDSEAKKEAEAETVAEAKESPIPEIETQYLNTLEEQGQKWSVSIEDLKSKQVYEHNAEEVLQSASVIKAFIMATIYDRVCYPKSEETTITVQESYDGELRELLEQMISVSDNDAANRLVELLGSGDFQTGAGIVNSYCQENGYTATSIGRRFLEENPTGDNYTSAADCRKLLSAIYDGSCVSAEASAKMLDILKMQTRTNKIPAGLLEGMTSANKTGEMPEGYGLGCIENDIAIIFSESGDYVICVLSNELGGTNEAAQQTITQISRLVAEWSA